MRGARRPSLRRVLNATGVLVHTNLGRAPLAEAALARVVEVGAGYSNLEYDLEGGKRGSRQDHLGSLLRSPHGRRGRSRGQQQRRGGAARARRARRGPRGGGLARRVDRDRGRLPHPRGARALRRAARGGGDDEPDACRRLRARDRARDRRSASGAPVELPSRGLLRATASSPSSPRSRGGTACHSSTTSGSGALARVGDEPTPAESLRAGADLVCFSGDKLLGGPQAGIVVGRAELVETIAASSSPARASRGQADARRARGHALARALSRDEGSRSRCSACCTSRSSACGLARSDWPTSSAARSRRRSARVGGGALPLAELPSAACAVEEQLAEPLRLGQPSGDRRRPRRPHAARLSHAHRRGDRRGRRGGRGRGADAK